MEEVPRAIGRYVIEERLGQGAFGNVYLSHDPIVKRAVALKVLRGDRFPSQVEVDAFIDEARKAGKLKHPAIVTVYDAGHDQGRPFVVREYVDGRDLASVVQAERLSPGQVADIMREVAEALACAHNARLVHRDLTKVPRELERICLKCLSKRMTDRYMTALDLANDLRTWRDIPDSSRSQPEPINAALGATTQVPSPRIIPKGLRSYGPEDADFEQ